MSNTGASPKRLVSLKSRVAAAGQGWNQHWKGPKSWDYAQEAFTRWAQAFRTYLDKVCAQWSATRGRATRLRVAAAASVAAAWLAVAPASAEMSATELAKLAQNPVGNLISVPFQNNTNLDFGPEKGTQNSGYYNVVHPDNGANWQIRAQVQFLFPK